MNTFKHIDHREAHRRHIESLIFEVHYEFEELYVKPMCILCVLCA